MNGTRSFILLLFKLMFSILKNIVFNAKKCIFTLPLISGYCRYSPADQKGETCPNKQLWVAPERRSNKTGLAPDVEKCVEQSRCDFDKLLQMYVVTNMSFNLKAESKRGWAYYCVATRGNI